MDLGPTPRILVSRTDRIGDVVLSLPVVAALRAAYPAAQIDFLVRRETKPLVHGQPGVSGIIDYAPDADPRELVARLAERKCDTVLCLYPRPGLARAFVRAGIPVRIGTARRWYSYRFSHRVKISRRLSGRHEKDLNLDLLAPLGIIADYSLVPQLRVIERSRDADFGLLRPFVDQANGRPSAVIHPGDGGSAQNWPIEQYAELASRLTGEGVRVVITGLAAERNRHLAVFTPCLKPDQILSGLTNLQELMTLLAAVNLFVGGSTGPLHIAAAVGTPVVGLYGPIRTTTPDRWGPCGDGHTVLTPDVPGCRCRVGACKLGSCMARIPLDVVLAACRKTLIDRIPASAPANNAPRISDLR